MEALRSNPYADVDWNAVEYHKAQLHAHSAFPETEGHGGQDPPETVIDDYHEAGYSVLALTGHEYNIEATTWPWTDWGRDPTDLEMVAIQGAELGGSEGGVGPDILSYFSEMASTVDMTVEDVLTEIGERDGLAVFPHPSRYHDSGEWYVEYFQAHPHLLGVEVVNAADRYPTGRDVWDDLQTRLGNERAVWGFANDDYHGREAGYSFDRSRNVLLLEELSETAVREALVQGRFFYQHVVEADGEGQNGGRVEPPVVEGVFHDEERGELAIEASGANEIQWASEGAVVATGPIVSYQENPDVGAYLRARLVSAAGSETGTQPFLLE